MEAMFRDLKADEIDVRIASVKINGLSLLLYKDARVDMDILDETIGPKNWQRKHSRDNANCIIEIWDNEKQQWISKEDTGVESFTQKEKGLASDSFKRAGFNWGIGRELYTAPFIWVTNKNAQIQDSKINATSGAEILWISDNEFITLMVPENRGKAPEKPTVPSGPIIQESTGKVMPARTYQDLLKNPYDEQLFDYYFTSQLVRIKEGIVYEIGKPAIYGSTLSLSPDKSLLLIATVHRPYSYQVPVYNFPQKFEVIDLQGNSIYTLADNPTVNIPMGYDTTSPYPRQFGWRSDQPATVYWAEAQDKGDPKQNKTDFMDIIYQISYPFNSEKQEVAKTEKRFRNILWNDDAFALLIETSRETRKNRTFTFKPCSSESPVLLFNVSTDDNYNNPGNPLTIKNAYGKYIVYTNKAHNELLMLAQGASPKGDMPYLSRYNLKTKKNTELWRCEDGYYETILKVANPEKLQLITSRQSITEPANLCSRDLKKKKFAQLTHFANPYPAMANVSKQRREHTGHHA